MKNNKTIYFWASNLDKSSGEGILGNNFLKLINQKYNLYKLENLNKTTKFKDNFFYNYIFIFISIFKIWLMNLKGYKTIYINYLPIWNFIIFLFLPKSTILGPITGTTTKKNFVYSLLSKISIFILKRKYKKLLFSNDFFEKKFNLKKIKVYSNFLLYDFKFQIYNKKKKYDFIIYYKKNSSKGNQFLINLAKYFSKDFKIVIIGDKYNFKNNKNINNFYKISRIHTNKIISETKYAINSKENLFSFFTLDCLSHLLIVFYNHDFNLDKKFKTNLLIDIDFDNLQKSKKKIIQTMKMNFKKKKLKFPEYKFLNYLK